MKTIWYFVGQIFSWFTIIVAIFVLLFDQFGLFETLKEANLIEIDVNTLVLKLILLLLTSFSAAALILLNIKFDNLDEAIDKKLNILAHGLNGVTVQKYILIDDGFAYWTERLKTVEASIEHVAFAPPINFLSKKRNDYEKSIDKILKLNKVKYRYVAKLGEKSADGNNLRRLDVLSKYLLNDQIKKYSVAYYLHTTNNYPNPMPSFMIIDNKEVITLYPKAFERDETLISIRHPEIIQMYSDYFDNLWSNAQKLDRKKVSELIMDLSTTS